MFTITRKSLELLDNQTLAKVITSQWLCCSLGKWQPKELYQIHGTRVIAWLSSDKFPDQTSELYYHPAESKKYPEGWYWGCDDTLVKRPDLIRGVVPFPEPPVIK